MGIFIWLGITFCALKAAIFSGLNLAYFSVPVLRLNILAKQKNPQALKILKLRKDPNFLLSTILWGNVSYNVLLALLANSVMTGLTSFLFSTVVLTLVGEIMPQATFSRKALKFGAFFAPMIHFYQILLYPIAKPTALALDHFLGKEKPGYYEEKDLIALIEEHAMNDTALDISLLEGKGAIEFLKLDDRWVKDLGNDLEKSQILPLEIFNKEFAQLNNKPSPEDPLISRLLHVKKEWLILTDSKGLPEKALDIAAFTKDILTSSKKLKPKDYCVKPMIINKKAAKVSGILQHFSGHDTSVENKSVVLFWQKRTKNIITSDDLMSLILS